MTDAALGFFSYDRWLTATAVALDAADRVLLPSICLVEKGRLDAAVPPRLFAELDNPATTLALAPLDLGVVLALQDISRFDVPDLPDRVIAATALHYCVPLVTRDREIRASGVKTSW